jgi:hypothetical protein
MILLRESYDDFGEARKGIVGDDLEGTSSGIMRLGSLFTGMVVWKEKNRAEQLGDDGNGRLFLRIAKRRWWAPWSLKGYFHTPIELVDGNSMVYGPVARTGIQWQKAHIVGADLAFTHLPNH